MDDFLSEMTIGIPGVFTYLCIIMVMLWTVFANDGWHWFLCAGAVSACLFIITLLAFLLFGDDLYNHPRILNMLATTPWILMIFYQCYFLFIKKHTKKPLDTE